LGKEQDNDDLNDEDGDGLASVKDPRTVTHVRGIVFDGIQTGNDTFVDSCSLGESIDRICRSVK